MELEGVPAARSDRCEAVLSTFYASDDTDVHSLALFSASVNAQQQTPCLL
jgi:hypothetical protein